MSRRHSHKFHPTFGVGLGKLMLAIGGIWYKRTAEARIAEMQARQALEDLHLAEARKLQIEAQIQGINARTQRTILAARVDITKHDKIRSDIEKMELQIRLLKRELGDIDDAKQFVAENYQA